MLAKGENILLPKQKVENSTGLSGTQLKSKTAFFYLKILQNKLKLTYCLDIFYFYGIIFNKLFEKSIKEKSGGTNA